MDGPTPKRPCYRQTGGGTVQQCTRDQIHEDPFTESVGEGVLSVYGISTSRVVKVLWAAAECPNVKDVRRLELRPVDLAPQPWFMELNPKGTVPVLRDGALVLNESNTMVSYICQKYGPHLYPDTEASLALAWQWLEYAETTMAEAQAPIFFHVVRNNLAYPFGSKTRTDDEIKALVPALEKAFAGLEQHLSTRSYIIGDSFSMGDITAGVQANRLFSNNGYGFAELSPGCFPSIASWLQRLGERPAFKQHVLGGAYAK